MVRESGGTWSSVHLDDERSRSLGEVLAAMSVGLVSAVGELYDLLGDDVWRASLIVSGDLVRAEQATISTFDAAWRSAGSLPKDPAAARRWLLRTACRACRELALLDATCSCLPVRAEDAEPVGRVTAPSSPRSAAGQTLPRRMRLK